MSLFTVLLSAIQDHDVPTSVVMLLTLVIVLAVDVVLVVLAVVVVLVVLVVDVVFVVLEVVKREMLF
jgi:hypothetical protein